MKGLLHSKKFRKNLYNWLFMYGSVMALFTTVITYSKYMTTMNVSDSARVAKFKIAVKNNDCNDTITEYCNLGKYRATSKIEYYFVLDTTEVEVKTKMYLTLFINSNFKFDKLEEINQETGEAEEVISNVEEINKEDSNLDENIINNYYLRTFEDIIELNGKNVRLYKITIEYKKSDYTKFNGLKDIIRVGYSARQIQE